MTERFVITNIDSILALIKDYAGEAANLPVDAKVVKMKLDHKDRKILFMLESEEWDGPQAAEELRFDLRRIYSVGK